MQETEAAENERVGWRHSLSALGQSATRVKSGKVHLELNPCMYSLDPPILIQAIPHSRVNKMGGGICNPTPMWQRRYLPLHLSSIVAQYCLPVTPFFQSESDCQTSPECLYKELEVCPSVDFFFLHQHHSQASHNNIQNSLNLQQSTTSFLREILFQTINQSK